ncbi:MAG: rhodanese-like domain-containing protein [Gallionellaceae bacterium]|nr:rhodanese-like domain-containing protein [Gallionellaceae bacterium]
MSLNKTNLVKHVGLSLTAAAVLFFSNAVLAGETPASLKGATLVDAAKVKSLIDGGAKAIDARVANEYAEGHIKGALSVPYKEKSAKAADFDASQDSIDLSKLPADKSAGLVFYCNGAECWKGYKAAAAAVKGGYKSVYWFRLGFPEWKAKGYPAE